MWRRTSIALTLVGWVVALPSCSNGQTGSVGYVCKADACQRSAQDLLDWFADRESPTFVEASCRNADLGPATSESLPVEHCRCAEADGQVWLIPATGPDDIETPECLAWGRGHFACVLPRSAVLGCTPADPRSCDVPCARLQRGYEEDAALDYDVELRVAECRPRSPGEDPRGGPCDKVARINGSCYASSAAGFFQQTPYSCSLSDDAIFALRDTANDAP